MAEWLEQASQWPWNVRSWSGGHELKPHRVELGVRSTSVLSRTWTKNILRIESSLSLQGLLVQMWLGLDKEDKDLFIGPQEFVVGYSKAPEQPQSSARPICHSHAMARTGREPATIRIAALELAALRHGRHRSIHHKKRFAPKSYSGNKSFLWANNASLCTSTILVGFGLVCLLTPGFSKDIRYHVWPYFSEVANRQIRHQVTPKVGCQPGYCIWSL